MNLNGQHVTESSDGSGGRAPAVRSELSPADWKRLLEPYQQRSGWRCAVQMLNTFVPFFALIYVAWLCLGVSYWLTLPVCLLAAGFLVRIFIIQHDCGHGTFFENRPLRDGIGFVCGVLTFTPYVAWARFHSRHHVISSNLDRRHEIDDVPTLTVAEYGRLSAAGRLKYRFVRNPFVILFLLPTLLFVFVHRVTVGNVKPSRAERLSVLFTDLGIFGLLGLFTWLIGFQATVMIYAPILLTAASVGLWIIYIEHQFESTHWANRDRWDFIEASLLGSSFLKLPGVLRWFTGNIGYHHIHHLSPAIPNYALKQCFDEHPELHHVTMLTIRSAFRSLFLSLWDEEAKRLISFRELKARRQAERLSPSPGVMA